MYEEQFRKTVIVIYKQALAELTREERVKGLTDFVNFITEELRRRRALRDNSYYN
jgi:hypothetical protein